MNKIIKYLEENNINYTIEVLKDGKFFIAQKYKYGEKCSPEIKKDLNYTLRLIKHEIRRNNGEYSRI